jgi:uncharacterized protein (TIGR02145 family)
MKKFLFIIILSLSSVIIHSQNHCPGIPAVTYAGRIYNTVKIGDRCWLKENINAGIITGSNLSQGNNGTLEKYCYNNDTNNCNLYGGLYQWNEAMKYQTTAGAQGICPDGWHIPTAAELKSLADTVQNDGNSLKAAGQGAGGGAGTNISGFTALLAGYRGVDGYTVYSGAHTRFWSSDEAAAGSANFLHLYFNLPNIGTGSGDKESGYSVRCVFNNKLTTVSEDKDPELPGEFILYQNFPNPFNPSTTIRYSLRHAGNVTITVYDLTGREAALIADEFRQPGTYSVEFNGSKLSSGIYYYIMRSGNFSQARKFVLVK